MASQVEVCPICRSEAIEEPVYLARVQEEIDFERMVIVCVEIEACRHVFCRACISRWMPQEGQHADGSLHKCPLCLTSYTDLLSKDKDCVIRKVFEKSLKELDVGSLTRIIRDLHQEGKAERAKEVAKFVSKEPLETAEFIRRSLILGNANDAFDALHLVVRQGGGVKKTD